MDALKGIGMRFGKLIGRQPGVVGLAVAFLALTVSGADLGPKAPHLRGVMLNSVPQERDFQFLHRKGATLARYQMVKIGKEPPQDAPFAVRAAFFDGWLGKRLDHLERNVLGWGRKYGIKIVVDLHDGVGGRGPGGENLLYHDAALADYHVRTWGKIAKRFKGNADVIYGYDFLNEPVQVKPALPDCDWWNLQRRCIEAVRAADAETTVIAEAPNWDLASGFRKMRPFSDTNIVYQVHVYEPHAFTHQFVLPAHTNVVDYPVRDAAGHVTFDKEALRRNLQNVRRFAARGKSRIYVGEFSAISWAPGESAARYLADCISLFEEYGWDWTYHAFREWQGWSVEHEPAGGKRGRFVPSADNARARVLYAGFGGECAPLVRPCASDERLSRACDAMWAHAMKTWNPETGLVTGCDISKSKPPANAKDNLIPFVEGRGFGPRGVADAALICGTALSGLVDKWRVTGDPKVAEEAAKVARGVLNLAILHGHPGFVCRGFCSDGRTTCALSSLDQYTHWVHGLWRYATSGMADPEIVAGYRKCIAEVARYMETRVTEEREWNFGLADTGAKDPRGICTLWGPEVWPHEAMRLPMIYSAAYALTGDAHWKAQYEKYIDPALDKALELRNLTAQQIAWRLPCYSLYQANVALELLLANEKDPARQAKIRKAMAAFAGQATLRRETAQRYPGRRFHNVVWHTYGMCWDGELLLAQCADPAYAPDAGYQTFLEDAVFRQPADATDVCRAAHIMAAYWRARQKVPANGISPKTNKDTKIGTKK